MGNIIIEKESSVCRIKLSRPEVHNAFNSQMIEDITKAFKDLAKDKKSRVVILSGEGKSFCAGADLTYMKSVAGYDLPTNVADSAKLFDMFESVLNCPIPVLGLLHGNIMGGGLGLAACCDIVACEKDSKFCFSEVKLGILPSVISPFIFRRCASHLAQEMMLTAEVFNAQTAKDMGLTHFYGDLEEINDHIQSKVDFILNNGPEAIKSLKQLLLFVKSNSWATARQKAIETIAERRVSAEGQEGIRSFLEKRAPSWKTQ